MESCDGEMKKWRICAFSLCLLIFFWVIALWQGSGFVRLLAEQEGKLNEMKNEYTILERLQQEHPDVERYQMEVEREKEQVAGLLPDNMQTAAFLQSIKVFSDSSGMKLRELCPEDAAEENGLVVMPVRVNLTGDYFSLLHFLRKLQSGQRLVQVEAMTVNQKGDALDCRLKIKVFSEKV